MAPEDKLPTQEQSTKCTIFKSKVQPLLQYIGLIGAIIMAIAYVILVVVIIVGFNVQQTPTTIVFAVVNGIVGIIIMQLLKIQGITFAKGLPENKAIADEYYKKDTKDKKYLSINHYWKRSVIKDICFKGLSIAFSTAGLIYIVIVGSEDYNLLLLALTNLLMFTCFGLLALNSAYEFYNQHHVPYMVEQLRIAALPKDPVVGEKPAQATETEILLALANLKAAELPEGE